MIIFHTVSHMQQQEKQKLNHMQVYSLIYDTTITRVYLSVPEVCWELRSVVTQTVKILISFVHYTEFL